MKTALLVLYFSSLLARAFSQPAQPFIERGAELDKRQKAAPTKVVWTTSTIFQTQTAQGKPVKQETTLFLTTTNLKSVQSTTTVTVTSPLVKRTVQPDAPLQKRQKVPPTPPSTAAVTSTRFLTSIIKTTIPGETQYRTITVQRATATTITNVRTVTKTSYTAAATPSNLPPVNLAAKPPFDYPEISSPGRFNEAMIVSHNDFRAKFGVPAIKWSPALASSAQKWVNQCKYYHSSLDANTKVLSAGESIAYATSETASVLMNSDSSVPFKSWSVDEFKKYSYVNRPQAVDILTGRFQNIVWRTYTQVGCAVSYCPNGMLNPSGNKLVSTPALYWSCEYDFPGSPDQGVAYNVPLNISRVF